MEADLIADDICIRAKWMMDEATDLHQAAERLRENANQLDKMHRDGWKLREPIRGDYGFAFREER